MLVGCTGFLTNVRFWPFSACQHCQLLGACSRLSLQVTHSAIAPTHPKSLLYEVDATSSVNQFVTCPEYLGLDCLSGVLRGLWEGRQIRPNRCRWCIERHNHKPLRNTFTSSGYRPSPLKRRSTSAQGRACVRLAALKAQRPAGKNRRGVRSGG
jgi:hypothetical protein